MGQRKSVLGQRKSVFGKRESVVAKARHSISMMKRASMAASMTKRESIIGKRASVLQPGDNLRRASFLQGDVSMRRTSLMQTDMRRTSLMQTDAGPATRRKSWFDAKNLGYISEKTAQRDEFSDSEGSSSEEWSDSNEFTTAHTHAHKIKL